MFNTPQFSLADSLQLERDLVEGERLWRQVEATCKVAVCVCLSILAAMFIPF